MMVLSCVCLLWLIWRDLVIVSLLNDICYCRKTGIWGMSEFRCFLNKKFISNQRWVWEWAWDWLHDV